MKTLPIIPILLLSIVGLLRINQASGAAAGEFVVEGADAMNDLSMTASSPLINLVNDLSPRFVIEFANQVHFRSVNAVPAVLQTQINSVEERPEIEFANALTYRPISYPAALINDTTPPSVIQISKTTANLYIVSNEYTTMVFQYGTTSGNYPFQLIDNLFAIQHWIPLSSLPAGQTVYYRVYLTDRSGNQSISGEYQLLPTRTIFLPLLKRGY